MYPLLIKGLFSNVDGTNNSLTTPGVVQWNNNIQEGRGNVRGLDLMAYNIAGDLTPQTINMGTCNVYIGGSIVLQNVLLNKYQYLSNPGTYEPTVLTIPPGQTVQFQQNAIVSYGAILHTYFDNKFNTSKVIEARRTAIVKQRVLQFTSQAFADGQKFQESAVFTVPTAIGNVVAIEPVIYGSTANIIMRSLYSVVIGGVKVVDNASCMLALPGCTRPMAIMPIVIRSGETFTIQVDTSAAGGPATLVVGLRLYFDSDREGKEVYA